MSGVLNKLKKDIEELQKRGDATKHDLEDLLSSYKDKGDELNKYEEDRNTSRLKQLNTSRDYAYQWYKKFLERNVTTSSIFEKMKELKKEKNWTDEQYEDLVSEFLDLVQNNGKTTFKYEKNTMNRETGLKDSIVGKLLGNPVLRIDGTLAGSGLNISNDENEKKALNKIKKIYEESKIDYKNVVIQSASFNSMNVLTMTGEYDRDKHDISEHFHPVFASLFMNKFETIDQKTLYTSISEIVKCIDEKKPITNVANIKLFNDLISDTNDITCDFKGPLQDLCKRAEFQKNLYIAVYKAREGNYYGKWNRALMESLGNCSASGIDTVNIIYNRDEGSVMRKFYKIFSHNPITITIYSSPSLYQPEVFKAQGSMQSNIFQAGLKIDFNAPTMFANQANYETRRISMLTLHIPTKIQSMYVDRFNAKIVKKVNIADAFEQNTWLRSEGSNIPFSFKFHSSNEIISIYVNRREQAINNENSILPITNQTISIERLPQLLSGAEFINDYPIEVPDYLFNGLFVLRSIVALRGVSNTVDDRVAVSGCTTLFFAPRNFTTRNSNSYFIYDPVGAGIYRQHPQQQGYFNNKPVSILDYAIETNGKYGIEAVNSNQTFLYMASKFGTIYNYGKVEGSRLTTPRIY